MELPQVLEAITGLKTVLDIYKGLRAEMPKGVDTKNLDEEIAKAEKALQLKEADLAKSLGYQLCRCTFPPQIMLWKEDRQKSVCEKCGKVHPPECTRTVIG